MKKLFLLLVGTCLTNTVSAMDNYDETTQASRSSKKISEKTYIDLAKQSATGNMSFSIEKRANIMTPIFESLNIRLSLEEIVDTFNKHKVIMNRKPKNSHLRIGCGNLPSYNPEICVFYIDDYGKDDPTYRARHQHSDEDTLDPDFARNPTIVGKIDELDPAAFKGHLYQKITTEGFIALPFDMIPDYVSFYQEDSSSQARLLQGMERVIKLLDDKGVYQSYKKGEYSKDVLVKFYDHFLSSPLALPQYLEESRYYTPLPPRECFSEIIECESLEEFTNKYGVTLTDILEVLNLTKDVFEQELSAEGWCNVEANWLPDSFKKKCYKL